MLNILKNYYRISDKLHTSAQPTEAQFEQLKASDIECVINLARNDSPDALANEAQIVSENEMDYIHIPVDFKKPNLDDLYFFFNTLRELKDNTKLVHCAYNWRVSCFVFLFRVIIQGDDEKLAKTDMHAVWEPDETWQLFIKDALSKSHSLKDDSNHK